MNLKKCKKRHFGRLGERKAQGEMMCHYSLKIREISEKTLTINSVKEGFITEIDSQLIAEIVSSLGAGRTKKEDDIDLSVGIELLSNIYDKVNIGTPLMKIYYNKIIEENIK